ncbi:hypothetical protein [Streptomyces sp. NPDC047024]|uniref:hypothetical protein n=1 Tax=Streptomyces sp. NPDC047024 TaxID=3155476 RepID=UPI003410D582
MSEDITLRKLPGESSADFIARVVAARPPLTGAEKAVLRAIFRPVIQSSEQRRTPGTERTAA